MVLLGLVLAALVSAQGADPAAARQRRAAAAAQAVGAEGADELEPTLPDHERNAPPSPESGRPPARTPASEAPEAADPVADGAAPELLRRDEPPRRPFVAPATPGGFKSRAAPRPSLATAPAEKGRRKLRFWGILLCALGALLALWRLTSAPKE